MKALAVEPGSANSLVRFSLGRESSFSEVEQVEKILPQVVQRAREFQKVV
jgi:cysteine sulfinate desulfinase/cysteine desulfurase-like protein